MQQAYRRYCEDVGFRALGPAFDMPVRWNSTFHMLDNLTKQRQYIHAFYNVHYPDNTIGQQDWAIIEGLHDILGDLKNATTLLSGIYYPTSPLLLHQLYILSSKIAQYEDHHDWGTLMGTMKAKLLKYFLEIPFSFLCAAALNPYLNVTGVEVLITQICAAFGLDSPSNLTFSRERIRVFNNNFQQLFDIYKTFYGGGSQQTSSSQLFPGSSSSSSTSGRRQNRADLMTNLMNEVMNESSKKSRFDTHDLGELNIYMRTNFISTCPTPIENFEQIDLLDFWKKKQPQFPVLACMARDILTVQASTVASESAFSLSGRIISVRRTRLTPESVECCICLKDYLDGVQRLQDRTSLETDMVEFEENIEENEQHMGLGTPPTTTDDDGGSSTGGVSRYDDDEEYDIDDLDEPTALDRLEQYGTLHYQPWTDSNPNL